jgi:hypothetical protein
MYCAPFYDERAAMDTSGLNHGNQSVQRLIVILERSNKMGWNYKNEEEAIEHLRKLNEKSEEEVLREIAATFSSGEVEKEEVDYETYVKYIVVYRSTGMEHDYETLGNKVNQFIENQSDSFILEGPVQHHDAYLVQTLINEDEM